MNRSKSDWKVLLALCLVGVFSGFTAIAHEGPIHEAITWSAVRSSSGLSAFFSDQFGAASAPFLEAPQLVFVAERPMGPRHSPVNWLKIGSREEDYPWTRTKNHFYDPTKEPAIGLTDGPDFLGIPSFTWASVRGGGGFVQPNNDSWQNARDYQLVGLTNASSLTRNANIAHMLYSLGRVIHLNQDLTQPDHARNDNHLTDPLFRLHWGNGPVWIEPHGLRYYTNHPEWFPLRPRGWPSWRDAGFTNLHSFWDRDLYKGGAQALRDDAGFQAGKQLGLAEFSNGNFLGEDAIYKEYFSPGDKHYFPFPSLETSTDFRRWVPQTTLSGRYVATEYLRNGVQGSRVFLSKIADGVRVDHHSVLTYTAAKVPIASLFWPSSRVRKVSSTINSTNVLNDYHLILLPKAIEYSAG